MQDVLDDKGVLFLTPDRKSTDEIVSRAVGAAATQIAAHLKVPREEAAALFKQASSPWHIEVRDARGWVFFFPASELEPGEDVNNPDIVYHPEGDAYTRRTYLAWKNLRHQRGPSGNRPRTVWDLVRDEE